MCPRLVKGYGDTHHRGSRNFAGGDGRTSRAFADVRTRPQTLRRLREAALADETSELLEQALRDVA